MLKFAVLIFCYALGSNALSVTYPGFGTFIDTDFYDLLHRPVLKLPESPEKIDPDFRLYTRNNPNDYENLKYNDSDALSNSRFRGTKKTKIIVHGFRDEASAGWMEDMTDEFLNFADLNVIRIDWSKGNQMPYSQAVVNTRIVGMMIGKFIQMAIDQTSATLDSFHILGHSLGSHVAGYAGKYLDGQLGQITGLDPAGPFYEGVKNKSAKLWHTDAKFVEVIHTDVKPLISTEIGLGMNETCGHVDVFPNGGHNQPGCDGLIENIGDEGLADGIQSYISCNHQRVHSLYTETINNQCRNPKSYMCESYEQFLAGDCTDCGDENKECFMLGPNSAAEYLQKVQNLSFSQGKRFFMVSMGEEPFFQSQLLIRVNLGPETDQTGRFQLKLYCDEEAEVNFPENDEALKESETYQKVFAMSCAPDEIDGMEFQWTSDKLLDDALNRTIFLNNVEVMDLATMRGIRSPMTYRFYNLNPDEAIPTNESVWLLRLEDPTTKFTNLT